jgi:hypothetical protein
MDITLKLPEQLVKQARAAGILTDERIAGLIEAELERSQRKATLAADIERLHNLLPPLTEEDIEAELKAFRQDRAAQRRAKNRCSYAVQERTETSTN